MKYLSVVLLSIITTYGLSSCKNSKYDTGEGESQVQVQREPSLQTNQVDLSDSDITDAVNTELMVQDGVYSHKIDVETIEGIVTLSGKVDNILAKDRAAKIARRIKGVRAVVNEINVEPTEISDANIQERIEKSLLTDPATDAYEITTAVNNGTVTLNGEVDSWQEKQLAEKVAKGVRGVTAVDNNIEFTYTTDRPDEEIETEIEHALRWNIRVDDGLIDVEVVDGMVELTGIVGSAAEKLEAQSSAWVSGVRAVSADDIKVERWTRDDEIRKDKYISKSDEEIKSAVEDAFLYDPRVNMFNPVVKVNDGKVTLTGSVDNLKAKRAAEMTAENVVGVWKVNNLLKVRTADQLSDEQIKENLTEALTWNPYVERFDIYTSVYNGKAYLSGTVDNYFEKYKAGDIASATKGVFAVENNIVVDNDTSPYAYDYDYDQYYPFIGYTEYDYAVSNTDWEIKEDIRDQLWWSPYVDRSEINVAVDNGIATLSGEVDTWSEYYHAEQNAYDGGALAVNNNLVVAY